MNSENKTTILIIAALPFYLNDFSNISVSNELLWLTIDYGLKLVSLIFLLFMLRNGSLKNEDLGLRSLPAKKFILWTAGITALGLCLDEPGFAFWSEILPSFRLGGIPVGPDSALYMLDMTLGLALVAIAEEVVFRGLVFSTLRERGRSVPATFFYSAIIFGFIHWSQGPVAVAATAVTGSGLMLCRWRTGSIYPTVIAHYVINYLSFSGLACRFWGI